MNNFDQAWPLGTNLNAKTALLKKNTRHESSNAMFPPKAGQIMTVFIILSCGKFLT